MDLKDNLISVKVTFDNPSLISMSDQSIQDRFVINIDKPLISKNGLPMDKKGLETNEDGSLKTMMDIQPMVDEESAEIESLDNASSGIFNVGVLMMVIQFLLTTVLSTSTEFFWTLINSQINFVYMPLLSVNAPGQVSFYFEVLIFVCTFDPIPMDIMYEILPIWSFNMVSMDNDRSVFSRIGLEDRNIVNVLGSLVVFATMGIIT